jgi:hypothetical protein
MRDSNLDVIIVGWQAAMSIIESYVLLGRGDFLRLHAEGVVKVFDIVIGNVKERGMLCTLPVIDSLIQVQMLYLNHMPGDCFYTKPYQSMLQSILLCG